MVDAFLSNFLPQLSGHWHMDETVLKFRPSQPLTDGERSLKICRRGDEGWRRDAIDDSMRFLVGA